MTYASESGHWYAQDGSPKYQVPYADPKRGFRNTTLKDAKKEGFLPSVTTILNVPAKPGLDVWKQTQVLEAAYETSTESISKEEWFSKVKEISSQKTADAATIGTAIHANIEHFIGTGEILSPEYEVHVENVMAELDKFYPMEFIPERSFAHPLGFGGKVDIFGQCEEHPQGIVMDTKSKDFTEDTPTKKMIWPEQAMQLDAYRHGLGLPNADMYSIFVDRTTGITRVYKWAEGDYFERFKLLLKYWKLSKGYDSSF